MRRPFVFKKVSAGIISLFWHNKRYLDFAAHNMNNAVDIPKFSLIPLFL